MTTPIRSVVVGTAGHIDHGKTTLVRALTGIDTDRLPEEKRRGITIDLGFASMEMQMPDGARLRLSFVDVPGHSLFVRNMLAGTGCVQAVMLVVAADEGIKPQTVEHLAICELLRISHGVVAVTKADAVNKEHLASVCGSIEAFLKGTFLDTDNAPIVAVSARTGAGLAALRTELIKLALRSEAANSDAVLRMPLDRSFVMKGFGAVVTGTLLSGSIHEGESLTLEPVGRAVRVRGLQNHGQTASSVQAGSRVAVNLSGIDASEINRGQMLVLPHTVSSVDTIDAEITLLPGVPPLKHRASVHFHAFTSETMATVSLYGYDSAQPGSRRIARLRLAKPIALVPGDRFVLRQPAPVATIGGGRVLDAHPEPRQRKADALEWLQQLQTASLALQLVMRVRRRNTAGLPIDVLAREAGLTVDAVRRHVVSALGKSEIMSVAGDLLLSRDAFQSAVDLVFNLVERAVRQTQRSGLKRSELRSQAGLDASVFDSVLTTLVREQKVRLEAESVVLANGSGASQVQDERLAAVLRAYEEAGLASPSVPELSQRFQIANGELRRIITVLQRERSIVRMGSDDLFVHANALRSLSTQMAELRGKLIDVGGFKELTGLSRKYAIPLLEYLDRERITRKQGDQRLVL
ncbi:MAG: selenocysteine-specific translation elongation factor [Proteobacteria bacterium]|nr:MAG: selenocysteine-specific translation elongation factor [Pseudomonadota bacterium]